MHCQLLGFQADLWSNPQHLNLAKKKKKREFNGLTRSKKKMSLVFSKKGKKEKTPH